jgi:hypothetical protein
MTPKKRAMMLALVGLLVWAGIIVYAVVRPDGDAPFPTGGASSPPPRSTGHEHHDARPSAEGTLPAKDVPVSDETQLGKQSPGALPAGAGAYSVAGAVLDCRTQRPLEGAHVDMTVALEVGLKTVHSTTDASGHFQFALDAASGQAAVLDAAAPGYRTGHWQVRDGERGKNYCLKSD